MVAPIAAVISSLKYGKCQSWGASTTPSSETKKVEISFLFIGLLLGRL